MKLYKCNYQKIGETIKQRRKFLGLKLETLAKILDLDPSIVAGFEDGSIIISVEILRKLQVILNTTFDIPAKNSLDINKINNMIINFKPSVDKRRTILGLEKQTINQILGSNLLIGSRANKKTAIDLSLVNAIKVSNLLSCTGLSPLLKLSVDNKIYICDKKLKMKNIDNYYLVLRKLDSNISSMIKEIRLYHKLSYNQIRDMFSVNIDYWKKYEDGILTPTIQILYKVQNFSGRDFGVRYIPKSLEINVDNTLKNLIKEFNQRRARMNISINEISRTYSINHTTIDDFISGGIATRLSSALILSYALSDLEQTNNIYNKKLIDINI